MVVNTRVGLQEKEREDAYFPGGTQQGSDADAIKVSFRTQTWLLNES